MEKKKATSATASSPKSRPYDTPSQLQRARILKALEIAGKDGMSTIELREALDILHPAGRVQELRESGHQIATVWTVTANAQGNTHRCARYVLQPGKGVAA